jgi:hypothetical protein
LTPLYHLYFFWVEFGGDLAMPYLAMCTNVGGQTQLITRCPTRPMAESVCLKSATLAKDALHAAEVKHASDPTGKEFLYIEVETGQPERFL